MSCFLHVSHDIDIFNDRQKVSVYVAINRFARMLSIADETCLSIPANACNSDIKIPEKSSISAWQSCMLSQDGCGKIETLLPREDQV